MLCSISNNNIGDRGASALAAILKKTKITTLGLATALECSLLCQRHLTLPLAPIPRSIATNFIGDEAKQALRDAAGSSVRIEF